MIPKVYDVYEPPEDVGVDCSKDEVRTKQSFREECDINVLVKRFGLDAGAEGRVPPMFGDYSGAVEFQEAQEIVARAQSQFNALPARQRERFHNDPAELLEFVMEESNQAEAVELGLALPPAKPVPVVPQQVQVMNLSELQGGVAPGAPIQVPSVPPEAPKR